MPNWVANRVSVSGTEADLKRFIDQANAVPITLREGQGLKEDGTKKEVVLSFANFIAPPQEAIDSGEYHETHGFSKEGATGQTENNWYNFNNSKWGTKWDVCFDSYVETNADGGSSTAEYAFDTAWSPPEPIFQAMVEQFPELKFDIWWEEEQGFGAELTGEDGELTLVREWDIPSSHADYVARDGDADNCPCSHDDDKEYWYDDCPGKRDIFVRVTKVYRLSSNGVTEARAEYFEMQNGSKELPEEEDGLTSFSIVNEDGVEITD